MQALEAEFTADQVDVFAVNFSESMDVLTDYIGDTGLQVPILLDNYIIDRECYQPPGEEGSFTKHLRHQITTIIQAPFPIQMVLDSDGRISYMSRVHHPAALLAIVRDLVDSSEPASSGSPQPE